MRSTFKITSTGDMRTVREDNAGVHILYTHTKGKRRRQIGQACRERCCSVEAVVNASSSCACPPGKQGKCFLLAHSYYFHEKSSALPGLLSLLGFAAALCSCKRLRSLVGTQGWWALEKAPSRRVLWAVERINTVESWLHDHNDKISSKV